MLEEKNKRQKERAQFLSLFSFSYSPLQELFRRSTSKSLPLLTTSSLPLSSPPPRQTKTNVRPRPRPGRRRSRRRPRRSAARRERPRRSREEEKGRGTFLLRPPFFFFLPFVSPPPPSTSTPTSTRVFFLSFKKQKSTFRSKFVRKGPWPFLPWLGARGDG